MTLDPPHTFILAKTKDYILRTKERKSSLLHLKIFFLRNVDAYLKFPMQKMFLEMFCSEYFEVQRKTIFIDTVEKNLLRKVDTYRKLPLQKIFLKMCGCNI